MKEKASPINNIWLGMILISVAVAAFTGNMEEVTRSSFDSSQIGCYPCARADTELWLL